MSQQTETVLAQWGQFWRDGSQDPPDPLSRLKTATRSNLKGLPSTSRNRSPMKANAAAARFVENGALFGFCRPVLVHVYGMQRRPSTFKAGVMLRGRIPTLHAPYSVCSADLGFLDALERLQGLSDAWVAKELLSSFEEELRLRLAMHEPVFEDHSVQDDRPLTDKDGNPILEGPVTPDEKAMYRNLEEARECFNRGSVSKAQTKFESAMKIKQRILTGK